MVTKKVILDGKTYLDGGTADSIPIKGFQKMGYDKNIVILTRPIEYRKGPEKTMALLKCKYGKYPNYIKACEERHTQYNKTLEELINMEKEGRVLIIRPSKSIKISRLEKDPEVVQAQYDLGRADTVKMLEQIKEFLG